jgi:hypothetical protein
LTTQAPFSPQSLSVRQEEEQYVPWVGFKHSGEGPAVHVVLSPAVQVAPIAPSLQKPAMQEAPAGHSLSAKHVGSPASGIFAVPGSSVIGGTAAVPPPMAINGTVTGSNPFNVAVAV